MRPRIVEVKRKARAEGAPQRDGEAVEGRRPGIHPSRHGTALKREKRIASVHRETFAVDVRASSVAIHCVEAIQKAPAVIVIYAVKVIRRCAAVEIHVLEP